MYEMKGVIFSFRIGLGAIEILHPNIQCVVFFAHFFSGLAQDFDIDVLVQVLHVVTVGFPNRH